VRWLLALVVLAVSATPAVAHQSSVKYVDVTVDGNHADVAFTVSPSDVTEPLGLPPDARPTIDAALAPAAAAYVQHWLALALPESGPCAAAAATARPDGERKFVIVSWRVLCPFDIDRIALDFTAFFALDRRHEAVVAIHAPGQDVVPEVVRADAPRLVARAGETSLLGWVRFGMDHIYTGYDHIAFVLALLLVVVLARTGAGWEARRPLAAVRATAAIVTSFTVAHSISLIAAALGYVELPSRFVESMIAASVLYTAVEDIVRPDVRWRFVLTFAFGLVHGLGFASQLQEQLPPEHVIVPLVCFNVGVEIGQLTVVAVALPLFLMLGRLGAERYRRRLMPAAAIILGAIAIKWLIERVLGM
jgi:hypothetical protein